MRHVIALMFQVFELLDTHFHVLKIVEDRLQQRRPFRDVARHVGEHVKKLSISGDQADHSGRSSLLERMAKPDNYRMRAIKRQFADSVLYRCLCVSLPGPCPTEWEETIL